MRIYEGMFVLDDARCTDNWDGVTREVRAIFEKNQADVILAEKWDDRRLAYPIRGHNRGIYLLVRFTAPSSAIASLERDCHLNDAVLRVLFTRDEAGEKLRDAGTTEPAAGEGATPAAPPAPAPGPAEAQDEAGGGGDDEGSDSSDAQ